MIYWPQAGDAPAPVPTIERGLTVSPAFRIPADLRYYDGDGADALEFVGATFKARIMSATLTNAISVEDEDGSQEDGFFAFNLTTEITNNMPEGVWRYIVEMDAEIAGVASPNKFRLTGGIVNVVDPLSPNMTHAQRMVSLLEALLEGKIAGRGDVTFYTIGDRQVGSASVETLRRDLFQYIHMASRERNPRQTWWRV